MTTTLHLATLLTPPLTHPSNTGSYVEERQLQVVFAKEKRKTAQEMRHMSGGGGGGGGHRGAWDWVTLTSLIDIITNTNTTF